MEHDEELAKMFEGVQGCVEANSYEYHSLWKDYSKQYYESFKKIPDSVTFDWKSDGSGLGKAIGKVGGSPVFLSLRVAEIDGLKILFYDATSRVVDWEMVENYLIENLPESALRGDGRYLNKTDATNFSNVIWEAKRKIEKTV